MCRATTEGGRRCPGSHRGYLSPAKLDHLRERERRNKAAQRAAKRQGRGQPVSLPDPLTLTVQEWDAAAPAFLTQQGRERIEFDAGDWRLLAEDVQTAALREAQREAAARAAEGQGMNLAALLADPLGELGELGGEAVYTEARAIEKARVTKVQRELQRTENARDADKAKAEGLPPLAKTELKQLSASARHLLVGNHDFAETLSDRGISHYAVQGKDDTNTAYSRFNVDDGIGLGLHSVVPKGRSWRTVAPREIVSCEPATVIDGRVVYRVTLGEHID